MNEFEQQVRWLVDRALISDLLVEFARALDERDWEAYGATYTEDGVLEIGDAVRLEGRAVIQGATASERGVGGYAGTWHGSSNHAITIDGDTATTRSYLHGVHLLGGSTFHHADGSGWYDCTLRRTPEGWRFTRVRIHEVWHAGEPLPHVAPSTGLPA
ncbi:MULTISPECIES: nuclear transport factor 2 family protein [unclassified Pseudonocardia]|jgi:ketosteroid isomerase-like protein|uniref:nuclear transport factor 2 family protein n=1 Tax=unclassified Pseudonocardia TaxID=2619320 RepID=UPI001AC6D018|nr:MULTISPECIES: nuclear transport factor 2 family protein [unclassified Pseudonocardia]MBN9098945.1 nuclear transport factor 2 family protein [Pseudonocardia sp.]